MEILSSIVNDGIRELYTFLREDPTRTKSTKKYKKAQKVQEAQKAQKATFFILDVSIRTKNTRRQKSGFFLLDVFMSTKMMPFVFLFAYVRFVLFVPNKRLFSS